MYAFDILISSSAYLFNETAIDISDEFLIYQKITTCECNPFGSLSSESCKSRIFARIRGH